MLKKFKYFLGLLFVGLFGLTCFSSAGSITYTGHFDGTRGNSRILFTLPLYLNGIPYSGTAYTNCSFSNYSSTLSSINLGASIDGITSSDARTTAVISLFTIPDSNNIDFEIKNNVIQNRILSSLFITSQGGFTDNVSFDWVCTISGTAVLDFSVSSCPEIDTNYCVENDLCPVSSGSWSELVINNIVHEGKPLINLNIPDYIFWDYTVNENQYDIYIGSGYDQDYIDSILAINSYRPDSEDFTNIFVSGLTLIFPYIFVVLLIVFIWKLLKRVFK